MEYISRFLGLLTNPRETIRNFPEKITVMDWLVPTLLVLVVSLAAGLLTAPITTELGREMRMESIQNSSSISEEAKEEMLDDLESKDLGKYLWLQIIGYSLVYMLMFAAVIAAIGSLILGGSATFLKAWHLVAWVGIIKIFELIISTVIVLGTGNAMVELGLSLILPASMADSFLYFLLMQFSFFGIWRTVIYGIGISELYNVDTKKCWAILFGIWFAFALVSAIALAKSGISL